MVRLLFYCICILLFIFPNGTLAQSQPANGQVPAVVEPFVEMAPYVVNENRILPNPERWHYVQVPALILLRGSGQVVVPGYEMLSNLTRPQTEVMVTEMQLRQFAAAYIWPTLARALPRGTIFVVVDGNQQASTRLPYVSAMSGWVSEPIVATNVQPSSNSFNSFRYGGSVGARSFSAEYGLGDIMPMNPEMEIPDINATEDQYEILQKKTETIAPQSVIKPLPDGFVIVAMNGGPLTALVRAGTPHAGMERPTEEQLAATLSYETNLFALNSLSQKLPLWFARGLSNLLGCTQVSHTRIQFALVREKMAGWNVSRLTAILTKTDSFLQEEALLASVFVHFGLYGDKGRYSVRFMQFVDRLARGEQPSETMFKDTFGMSMKKMENVLTTYARDFAYHKSTDIKGDIPQMPAPIFRMATQSEVARIKGEVDISLTNPAKALDELRIAYWRGERDATMLALLGRLELQIGSESRARKILKALGELPAPPPQSHIATARLQLKDMYAAKPAGSKLSADETAELLEELGRAVTGGITTEDLCDTLAEVVINSAVRPHAEIVAFLGEAAKRYPKNRSIAEAIKAGRISDA